MKRTVDNNHSNIFRFLGSVLLIIFSLGWNIPFCAAEVGSSSFSFLRIGAGAGPVGMAEAYTALADDINAIYWNPAGLGKITRHEITASYLSYVVNINSGYLGYAQPMLGGGFGIGLIYLDYGAIPITTGVNPTGEGEGTYRPYDIAAIISYGCRLNPALNVGINLKGVYEDIQGYTANGVALDLGGIFEFPGERDLSVGLTVKNLGYQTKAFIDETHNLPLTIDLGWGYKMLSDTLRWGLDGIYQPLDEKFNANLGGEYCWREKSYELYGRLGYRTAGQDLKTDSSGDFLTGFCMGIGASFKNYQLDYAFVPFNQLGYVHRVSLGMQWGGTTASYVRPQTTRRVVSGASTARPPVARRGVSGKKYFQAGQKFYKQKKYRTAIREYKRAISRGYKTAKVYEMMGYCHYQLGQKSAARRAYKQALKLEPNNQRIKKSLQQLGK